MHNWLINHNHSSDRLRYGSIILCILAISVHEYYSYVVNVLARDRFPYVLYCAIRQQAAKKVLIDLWNQKEDKRGTVLNTHGECLTALCVSNITSICIVLSSKGIIKTRADP